MQTWCSSSSSATLLHLSGEKKAHTFFHGAAPWLQLHTCLVLTQFCFQPGMQLQVHLKPDFNLMPGFAQRAEESISSCYLLTISSFLSSF